MLVMHVISKKMEKKEEVKKETKKRDCDLVASFFVPRNRRTWIEGKSSDSAAALSFGGRVKKRQFLSTIQFPARQV